MSETLLPPATQESSGQLLFDERMLPVRQELVDLVKATKFEHNGKYASKDEELCRDVCIDLISGLSTRQVAKKYKISRNTVSAIHAVMEERGELEPLKKQVSKLLGKAIHLGLENLVEAITTDQINPGQLPIPIAALIDKKALIDGDPTARIETQRPPELTIDNLRARLERMKRANAHVLEIDGKPTAIDSESTDNHAKH